MVTLPCSPDAPIPFVGDETINIGIMVKAILAQPEKTLGRYVLGNAEVLSCKDWMRIFTGVLQGKGLELEVGYIECTLASFEAFWGHAGTEIGLMFKYFEDMGLEGYKNVGDGDPILTMNDLGIQGELRSTQQRLADMDIGKLT